jgi:Ca2+-binding RTX toxin-like protein
VYVADGTTSVNFSGISSAGLTIIGTDANKNSITGDAGGNTLIGGNGTNDTLTGGSGADTFISRKGSDRLSGNSGDDIYVFSKGDGQDTISDSLGSNTVRFLDVKSDEITLARNGTSLEILYGESDSLTIQSHFFSDSCQMAEFEFEDVTLIGVDLMEMYGM